MDEFGEMVDGQRFVEVCVDVVNGASDALYRYAGEGHAQMSGSWPLSRGRHADAGTAPGGGRRRRRGADVLEHRARSVNEMNDALIPHCYAATAW